MNKNDAILVLGSRGLVGSAIVRELEKQAFTNILKPVREELDLLLQSNTLDYFQTNKPKYVFLAAAKVGGIHANNTYRADFIFDNLTIQQNVFNAAFKTKVDRLLFLGSSCIYPKNCPQPIKEEYLLTGPLEPTNEPYAIAKIAGLKTAEAFKDQYGLNYSSVMPTNLYGENDNFHIENSHVIPGLIARMEQAIKDNDSEFKVWGTGKPKREFLHVDDMANACIYLMQKDEQLPSLINIGTGQDIEIGELAKIIADKMGYKGEISFDPSKPDGTMRKLLDVSLLHSMGWHHKIDLNHGLDRAINFYRNNV
ncbi:GDP-L-fucose synthase family protein [Halobacteriovorax sp. RT-1-4]|uniref:GDP-L-fucose synthase family protein n=1 Tax=unclassified Halobacteriovorax TaxID=2639665 RepID=UPI00399999B7